MKTGEEASSSFKEKCVYVGGGELGPIIDLRRLNKYIFRTLMLASIIPSLQTLGWLVTLDL